MRKNWKMLLLAAVVIAAMCISDGCASGGPDDTGEQKAAEIAPVQPVAEDQTAKQDGSDGGKPEKEDAIRENTQDEMQRQDAGMAGDTADAAQGADAAGKEGGAAAADASKEDEYSTDDGTDAETFCGDVEQVDGDSVVCSRIETYKTEGGQGEVAVATTVDENKDLVTVRFAQDAVYTYQIIRDGGADVKTSEGSFADIKAGLLLDFSGHYDGNVFWADTVRISDVRND